MSADAYITYADIRRALPSSFALTEGALVGMATSRNHTISHIRVGNERLWRSDDIEHLIQRRNPRIARTFRDNLENADVAAEVEEAALAGLDSIQPYELGFDSPVPYVQALNLARRGAPFLVYREGEDAGKKSATRNLRFIRSQFISKSDVWRLLGSGLWILEFNSQTELDFLQDEIAPLSDTWSLINDAGKIVLLYKRIPLDPSDRAVDVPLFGTKAMLRDSTPLPDGRIRWHPHCHPLSLRLSPLNHVWLTLLPRTRANARERIYEEI